MHPAHSKPRAEARLAVSFASGVGGGSWGGGHVDGSQGKTIFTVGQIWSREDHIYRWSHKDHQRGKLRKLCHKLRISKGQIGNHQPPILKILKF